MWPKSLTKVTRKQEFISARSLRKDAVHTGTAIMAAGTWGAGHIVLTVRKPGEVNVAVHPAFSCTQSQTSAHRMVLPSCRLRSSFLSEFFCECLTDYQDEYFHGNSKPYKVDNGEEPPQGVIALWDLSFSLGNLWEDDKVLCSYAQKPWTTWGVTWLGKMRWCWM